MKHFDRILSTASVPRWGLWLRSCGLVVLAAALLWFGRAIVIGLFPSMTPEQPAYMTRVPAVLLGLSGYALSVAALLVLRTALRQVASLIDKCAWVLAFSILGFAPNIPDLFSAFLLGIETERRLGAAAGLTVSTWIALAGFCVPLRLLICLGASSVGVASFWKGAVVCCVLPILELSYLFVFPMAHVGATLPPVPGARLMEQFDESNGRLHRDGLERNNDLSRGVDIVVSSLWSGRDRDELSSAEGSFALWGVLQSKLTNAVRRVGPGRVRIFFPETFFGFEGRPLVELYELAAATAGSDRAVEFIAGVGGGADNKVVWVGRDPVTGSVRFLQAAKKRELVPFFEQTMLGLMVWASADDSRAFWDGLLPIGSSFSEAPLPSIRICYEGLFPQYSGESRYLAVFGNHHLFRSWLFMSRAFDYELRLVAQLTNSVTLLVQNGGDSGLLVPHDLRLWQNGDPVNTSSFSAAPGQGLSQRMFVLRVPGSLGDWQTPGEVD